jgi:hypothetical protein
MASGQHGTLFTSRPTTTSVLQSLLYECQLHFKAWTSGDNNRPILPVCSLLWSVLCCCHHLAFGIQRRFRWHVARPCVQTPTSVFSTTPEFVVCSWSWTVMRNLFSLVVNRENPQLWESSWGFSRFTTRAQTCLLSTFFYIAFKSESCDAKQIQLKLTTADGSTSRIENLVAPRVNIRDCSFRSSPACATTILRQDVSST